MSKVCGVIAEYDPFHNGHAWHLQQAKKDSKADFLICVMSCAFTQRGMPAYLRAHDRAEMALRNGADIVLGLPYAFSVCDAEHFALGGVEILRKTGVVNALSFGVEAEGAEYITSAAELLEKPDRHYTALLKAHLDAGLPYPLAQGRALGSVLQIDSQAFSLPNTSLAICYARANQRLQAHFAMHPVIRRGAYHDKKLPDNEASLPSATAVRQAISAGNFQAVQSSMPPSAYDILLRALQKHAYHPPGALDLLLRWKLQNAVFFGDLPDLSEGIENRFKLAAQALTRNEMVKAIKSKRYPYARINRLISHVLTDASASHIAPLPDYAYLLGFRQEAAPLLHDIAKGALTLLPRLPSSELSPMMRLDKRADDLWALGAGLPFGSLHRAKPVIIP